jgi:hypothetical protein
MRRLFTINVLACLAAGVGLWCARGALDVASTPRGVVRVAMVPSWPDLVGGTWIVLLVAWLTRHAVERFGSRRVFGVRLPGRIPRDLLVPLFALLVLILPFLPWAADRLPVLQALAGPAGTGLWLVVLVAIAWSAWDARGGGAQTDAPEVRPRARHVVLVWIISAAVYGAAADRLIRSPIYPGGDEPHYLVMTQSLVLDHDLAIENNHARGDYRAYFGRGLAPDYRTRGRDGVIYSIHPVGLPIVVAPAFAVGGYTGVVMMLVILAACGAALAWWIAARVTSPASATIGWLAAGLSTSYVLHSFAVYPEVAAGVCAIVALWWRGRDDHGRAAWVTRGLAVAALPWLGTKYAPMSLVIAAALALRARRQLGTRGLVLAVVPYVSSVAGWLLFFQAYWGSPLPSVPYGADHQTSLHNLVLGLPGLFVDQEYGVLPYAPALLFVLPGVWGMWQAGERARTMAVELVLAFGALAGTVGAFAIWWGGSSPPGRELVAGLLLLVVPLAQADVVLRTRPVARWTLRLLTLAGLAVCAVMASVNGGLLIANDRDGTSKLLRWLLPSGDLARVAPSAIAARAAPTPFVVAVGCWAIVALVFWWLARRQRSVAPGRAAFLASMLLVGGGITGCAVSAAMGGGVMGAAIRPDARAEAPMLSGFDARRRPVAFVYDALSRVAPEGVPSYFALTATPGLRTSPQPLRVLLNMRLSLPAGRYRLAIEAKPDRLLRGAVGLQVGRTGRPIQQWTLDVAPGATWSHPFELAVDTNFVAVRGPADVESAIARISVDPEAVVNQSDRPSVPPVLGASRYGDAVVYFHSEGVYPETTGFWVRARSTVRASVAVPASHGAKGGVRLKMHGGDAATRVELASQGWTTSLSLEPGHTEEIQVPARRGTRVQSISITPQSGFVPGGGDRRELGCWVEIVG